MADGSTERPARVESGEIATSTLAEIYAQQGLLGRALSIYRRMLTRTPDDREIAGRILSLEQRIAETGAEPAVERGSEPAASRERLPWDPPVEDVAPEPGGQASGTEVAENGRETPDAREAPEGSEVEDDAGAEAPKRWSPIDPRAFEAWLERR
jgi:hypothetical protein